MRFGTRCRWADVARAEDAAGLFDAVGGASLGAYQAGAGAALLAALGCIRDEHGVDVRVDAIGGASAGSIVALMVAHFVA